MDEDYSLTIESVATGPGPFSSMGRMLQQLRKARGLNQREVAARGGLSSHNRVSEIENGMNVQLEQLHGYAKGLGYRSIVDMLRTPADPQLRRLIRMWAMLDDEERTDVLQKVQEWIADRAE